MSETDPECALATFPDCDELVASDKKCLPRKYKDSGIPGDPYKWNRYLARDPPSYDSGTLLSEADAKTMMDKIETRSKWLKANGKAPKSLGKHQRAILARAKSKADVKMDATTNKPSDVDGHRPHPDDPDIALSKRARRDTHDTPPHKRAALESSDVVVEWTDSAIIPAALVSSPCPHEVGHRPPCDDPDRVREEYEKSTIDANRYLARDPQSYDSGIPLPEAVAKIMMDKIKARSKTVMDKSGASKWDRAQEYEYEKGTIAGDDPKAFRDKYHFLPHRETETNLSKIWAAMQREAYKTCPSSRDHTKLKAAFQQYKDANTNWKDILLAYRADKIKEWNQDLSSCDYTNLQALEKFQQQHQRLPRWMHETRMITSEDRHEQRLANWLNYVWRKHHSLGTQRQLTPTEAAQLMRLFAAQVIKDHRSGEDDSGGGEEPSMSIRRLYENVIEWQSQRCTNSIPRRHFFADDEERRLAYRLAYYKSHALSQSRRPKLTLSQSRRPKLTKGDKALINIIVGKAHKRSQNEEVRRRCRHKRCVMRR